MFRKGSMSPCVPEYYKSNTAFVYDMTRLFKVIYSRLNPLFFFCHFLFFFYIIVFHEMPIQIDDLIEFT